MNSIPSLTALLFAAMLTIAHTPVLPAQEAGPIVTADQSLPKIFSGKPCVIVVNGYSTSFHWPKMLQRKIDRLMEESTHRTIEIKSATQGGTPIAKWMDVKTGKPLSPWMRKLRPAIRESNDVPVIVLCQQSLQWVFDSRSAGIRNDQDMDRIERGASALESYARQILKDGAEEVFIAMHIYKNPMEPEIGNEHLALAALLKRNISHVHSGPDVWDTTKNLYPKAFARDKLHPNSIGAEVMAQLWFETLLKHEGREVPEWSRTEMQAAIESKPVPLGRQ